MNNNVKETLTNLLDLADIDSKIALLREEQSSLPTLVQQESQEIIERQNEIQGLSRDIQVKEATKKELASSLEEKNLWVTTREDQIKDIKTNKEYQAALKEISTAKKEIKDKEAALEKLLPELESQISQLKGAEEKNNPIIEGLKVKILEKKTRFEELKNELDSEKQNRGVAMQRVTNKQALKYYEKIHSRLEPAISKVTENCICTECGTQLLPQTFNLLAVGETIQTCNGCKRILYLEKSIS